MTSEQTMQTKVASTLLQGVGNHAGYILRSSDLIKLAAPMVFQKLSTSVCVVCSFFNKILLFSR